MAQPAAGNAPEWSVSELAGALKRTVEDAFGFVRLRGELGKVTRHASGHVYLDLKDEGACIAGVIWRNGAARLRVKLEPGMEVVATGRITTFPGQSKYQIVIEAIEPAGVGALMAMLDERRRRLDAEGLFAAGRKRRPPFLPTVVGVVTSPTGAVIRDILHRIADRFPRPVLLWPVRVQGETCGAEVAAAIAGFDAMAPGGPIPRPDVLIVARGGGSVEDLWGFNDEAVVRAAAACRIPLISAIGHETDWTLLDHVADLRAPTPTGAAEMAVPVRSELLLQVAALAARRGEGVRRGLEARRAELRSAGRALPTPEALLAPGRQRLDLASLRLGPALGETAARRRADLRRAADALGRRTPRVALADARASLRGATRTPLRDWIARSLAARAQALDALSARLVAGREVVARAERERIAARRERVAGLAARARHAAAGGLATRAAAVASLDGLLRSLGYRSVLERGFALVRREDGRPVTRAGEVEGGERLLLAFADGERPVRAEGEEGRPRPSASGRRRASGLAQASLFDH